MKILFFSPYYYPYISGVTVYPQKILSHLAKKNEIQVLTFKLNKNLKNRKRLDNYQIDRMNYLFKISKGFISPQSLVYFYEYVKKFDIIILNQPNFEGLVLAFLAYIYGKRVISIVHCQVTLHRNILNWIINLLLNLSFYMQLWLSNVILPTTKDYADSLPFGKLFKNKIKPILPPINLSSISNSFSNKLKDDKKNNIWIGYVGRIAKEKGIEYLVQSINQLSTYNKKVILVFAGPHGKDVSGEDVYYRYIISLLRINKIKYKFLGNLSINELSAFYKAIDILVLPSINRTEAFGMVQAEAMVSGTPVIATNLPGVRIPIRMTKMGLIVEPRNPEKIKQAIFEIIKNRNEYSSKKLIINAKKIFKTENVYRFYDKLVTHFN